MQREESLKVRLSKDEANEVRAAAFIQLITVSAFMRQSVMAAARKVNAGEVE